MNQILLLSIFNTMQYKILIAFFTIFALSVSATPHWSIETIHHDIMRAKEKQHKIYEVEVAKVAFRSLDTIEVDRREFTAYYNCQKDCDGIDTIEIKKFQIELKVISTILENDHPSHIPLVVIDRRIGVERYWLKVKDWISKERPRFIAVVGDKGNLIAFYPEKFQLGGDEDILKKMKPKFRREILQFVSTKEYEGFVNIKNLKSVLSRAGLKEE